MADETAVHAAGADVFVHTFVVLIAVAGFPVLPVAWILAAVGRVPATRIAHGLDTIARDTYIPGRAIVIAGATRFALTRVHGSTGLATGADMCSLAACSQGTVLVGEALALIRLIETDPRFVGIHPYADLVLRAVPIGYAAFRPLGLARADRVGFGTLVSARTDVSPDADFLIRTVLAAPTLARFGFVQAVT